MINDHIAPRLALGVAAGLAATLVIQGLQTVGQKVRPQSMPPLLQDPGEFMVQKAEEQVAPAIRARIPPRVEKAAATSLALGYGATFGALYAASRPEVERSDSPMSPPRCAPAERRDTARRR